MLHEVKDWQDFVGMTQTSALADLFNVDEDSSKLNTHAPDKFHCMVAQLPFSAKRAQPDALVDVVYLSTRVKLSTCIQLL